MGLENDLLDEIKSCNKEIFDLKPKKEKQQYNHKQQSIFLCSSDKKYHFEIFTRQNIDLLQNFSVGLIYKGADRTYIICRYNGDHGEHRNKLSGQKLKGFHKHTYNIEYVEEGLEDDSFAEITSDYQTMEQALYKLLTDYNVINYKEYFPNLIQGGLFS